tara:strand:- start:1345 stop:1614 length:270 start_codon:yes stop_codon:yes gene_type:complete
MNTMDDFKTDEEIIAEALEAMTPMEQAIHNAMVGSYMLSQWCILQEVVTQIEEVEILKKTGDLEERALLPLAEASLIQLIKQLPTIGDA